MFCSELRQGARPGGRPKKRFTDNVKASLRSAGVYTCYGKPLLLLALSELHGVKVFEDNRITGSQLPQRNEDSERKV